jgi:siroheme synthase (precorrin-2 oxidase/ferrochelatase)
MCRTWRLFSFFNALKTRVDRILYDKFGDEVLDRCRREEFERLPKRVTTRDVWEEFLHKDACRFHQHGEDVCGNLATAKL